MTPDERNRAGEAVADRIKELHTSAAGIARAAGVDPKAVRGLMKGTRWPNYDTRTRIERALKWSRGEIGRRASKTQNKLSAIPLLDLLGEACRRIEACEAKRGKDT